jgi:hypothetical protein
MKDISVKDLADLVVSEVPEADSRIEKLFDWHFQRDTMITKWILGIAASLGVTTLLSRPQRTASHKHVRRQKGEKK